MQITYIYFLSSKHTHSNVSLPCFLNFIILEFVPYWYIKNVLILFYDCIMVHGTDIPGVFLKLVCIDSEKLFLWFWPSSLSIWPGQGQLKEGCPFRD